MEPKVPRNTRRGRPANSPGGIALSPDSTALPPGCAALAVAAGILCTAAAGAAELAPHDMILLDRLTWGINASSAAHLQAVGTER